MKVRTIVVRKAALGVTACSTLIWVGTALATPTAQQNCDNARITAWKTYVSCVDAVVAKHAKGVSFDEFKAFWKCRHAYFRKWTGFQGKAKYAGSSCDQTVPAIGGRFTDNGDQTVTDNLSALVWEKKDNLDGSSNNGDPHDADNTYTLSTGSPYEETGTMITSFLAALDTGGFGGSNFWRPPTLAELQTTMLDFTCTGPGESPTCGCTATAPCVDPALDAANTQSNSYWSATSDVLNPGAAWSVYLFSGVVSDFYETLPAYARAVRGGL